jgi:hypothetical protein
MYLATLSLVIVVVEAATMRAVEIPGYIGTNLSAITVVTKEKPTSLGPEDVLVRVHGSSVNPVDWDIAESPIYPGCPAFFPAVIGMVSLERPQKGCILLSCFVVPRLADRMSPVRLRL